MLILVYFLNSIFYVIKFMKFNYKEYFELFWKVITSLRLVRLFLHYNFILIFLRNKKIKSNQHFNVIKMVSYQNFGYILIIKKIPIFYYLLSYISKLYIYKTITYPLWDFIFHFFYRRETCYHRDVCVIVIIPIKYFIIETQKKIIFLKLNY